MNQGRFDLQLARLSRPDAEIPKRKHDFTAHKRLNWHAPPGAPNYLDSDTHSHTTYTNTVHLSIKPVPDVLLQMHHRWLPMLLLAKVCLKQQHCFDLDQQPTFGQDQAY